MEINITYSHKPEEDRVAEAQILGAFGKLRKATISFVISVRLSLSPSVRPSAWKKSAPTGRIFMPFDIWRFFETLSRKFNFH
jgi:hypothetical protein